MKNLIFAFLATFIFTNLSAQSCADGWLPFTEGMSYEQTNYNKKGKVEGVTSGKIVSVTTDGGVSTAVVETDIADKKGDEVQSDLQIEYICEGDSYRFDMNDMLRELTESMGAEADMEMSGSPIIFPRDVSVGDKLEDAQVTFSIDMGVMKMKGEVNITNRRVVAKKQITVPAGTFETIQVEYDLASTVMGATSSSQVTDWLARGVGAVKQETRRNGKLSGYMELTKLNK